MYVARRAPGPVIRDVLVSGCNVDDAVPTSRLNALAALERDSVNADRGRVDEPSHQLRQHTFAVKPLSPSM